MKNHKEGFAGIIIVVIVALGILGFGAYKVFNQPVPVEEGTNAEINNFPSDYKPANHSNNSVVSANANIAPTVDTSDWKTYDNPNYRFAFKYPSDWKIQGDPFFFVDSAGHNKGDITSNAAKNHPSLEEQEARDKSVKGETVDSEIIKNANGISILRTAFGGGTQSPPLYRISFIADDAMIYVTIFADSAIVDSIISSIKFTK